MALETGSKLGHYEVLSSLGAGGMGEVYRALDTKLGREVAIKLLLDEVSADPERLARFEREARVLASLNHPNVATLHGFETEEGTSFLVMELVEGETLADRIARGPISVDEAIPLFIRIAEGLEAAHEKGVMHRDLKPANIKLGHGGAAVKILDFGLAKALAPDAEAEGDVSKSLSPTLTLAATRRGEILGTAAYMSPEQASGKPADSRADVWAFGVCLFEALTGTRPFVADDAANTLAAVLRDEVDLSRLPADCSPSLLRLLRRCLERTREQRLQHIGDARIELEAIAAGDEPLAEPSSAPAPARAWGWRVLTHLVAAAAATGIYVGLVHDPPATAPPLVKYRIESRTGTAISVFQGLPILELARDGTWLASTPLSSLDRGSSEMGIYVKQRDRLEETGLENTAGANYLLASASGEEIAFFARDGRLRAIGVEGGIPRDLGYTSFQPPLGATWLEDGSLVLAHSPEGERPRLVRASSLGEAIFGLESDANSQAWPQALPGGRHVLYVGRDGDTAPWNVKVGSLETGSSRTLTEGRYARFASSGHVVFARDDVLFAVAVDTDDWQAAGEPVPMIEEVISHAQTGGAQYALAEDGTLAYLPADQLTVENQSLVWVDREGRETRMGEPATSIGHPRLSPDGRHLVAARIKGEPAAEIVLFDLSRGLEEQLTRTPSGPSWYPLWMHDGGEVAFMDTTADGAQLFVLETTGSRRVRAVLDLPAGTPGGGPRGLLDAAPSGDALLHAVNGDLVLVPVDGGGARALLETPGVREQAGSISPDGRWIVYQTDRDGRWEVEVRPFPDLERDRWRVSTEGGELPAWARDGSEIYFWRGRTFMAAKVRAEADSLEVSPPEALFSDKGYRRGSPGLGRTYDPAPDGRFVMVKQDVAGVFSLVVVQNWHEELERLAPTP
jgi:serine/threonine-protein kinase